MISIKLNPLLAYLLKRKHLNILGELWPIFALWSICILFIVGLFMRSSSPDPLFIVLCVGLTFIPITLLPVLTAYSGAAATSRLVSNQGQDLLALTNIPEEMILWSYVIASLYRLRGLLVVVTGLLPIFFLMTGIAWIILRSGFDASCVISPLGNTYCANTAIPPAPTDAEKIAGAIQLSFAMINLACGTAGTYLLMAIIGGVLGCVQKDRLLALLASGALGFVVSLLFGFAIVPEVMFGTMFQQPFEVKGSLLTLALAMLPFGLAFGLARVASPLVRRPA